MPFTNGVVQDSVNSEDLLRVDFGVFCFCFCLLLISAGIWFRFRLSSLCKLLCFLCSGKAFANAPCGFLWRDCYVILPKQQWIQHLSDRWLKAILNNSHSIIFVSPVWQGNTVSHVSTPTNCNMPCSKSSSPMYNQDYAHGWCFVLRCCDLTHNLWFDM